MSSPSSLHLTALSRLLIDTHIKDSTQREYLFDTMDATPCVKRKADWALKWISDHSTFVRARLTGHSSGYLISILPLFKKCGLVPGLMFFNELISCGLDEGVE
ncbi:hypothetical protein F4604DRAFT_1684394 [Suillus subluteus]|nr:hypothetical protein F4604DRAFT_1684394 [Suillus subluteus]